MKKFIDISKMIFYAIHAVSKNSVSTHRFWWIMIAG